MQKRHKDRYIYFQEQASTSRDYYIKYVERFKDIRTGLRVMEIGCGEGGNLLPFAEKGCSITGVDLSPTRIGQANEFFEKSGYSYKFMCMDFCKAEEPVEKDKYDVILVHDVIEHIPQSAKTDFLKNIHRFLHKDGIVFFAFPAWQMPFGGHQQICRHKTAKLPWIHLLPQKTYKKLLTSCGEDNDCIQELMGIHEAKMQIEPFEKLCHNADYTIAVRTLWLINPHYLRKFGLRPRKVIKPFSHISYLRNFYTTSCFYILRNK